MSDIIAMTDDIEKLLAGIDAIIDSAKDKLHLEELEKFIDGIDLSRRRLVAVKTSAEVKYVTIESVSAMAYQKGLARFHELYGEHVSQVFHERKLATNGARYIGFESLKLKFTAEFNQTLDLNADDRAGLSGSIFDEALHRSVAIHVPFTGGMVKLVASGSLEASMPYAMSMEAAAVAGFGRSGSTTVTLDVMTGEIVYGGNPLVSDIGVDTNGESLVGYH